MEKFSSDPITPKEENITTPEPGVVVEKPILPQSEELLSLLGKVMTAEEYSKLEHSTPYLYELKNGEKELLYFGAYHSRNPEDGIFKDIENKFNEVTPDLVLIEGMSNIHQKRESFEKNEMGLGDDEDAIRKKVIDVAGESGFALYLAIKKGIDCESPEPEDADMYNALLEQGFSKEDIFAEQIFLVLPQYHRQTEQKGFKEYTEPFIDSFKKATNWEDFDYSYDHALEAAQKAIGKDVDVENDEQTLDYVDPIPWENKKDAQTVMNQIARATSAYRDKFMVSEIAKAFQTHKKVFVVFGASHAVMQEPALKELFHSPESEKTEEVDSTQEFKGLIKQTLFGDSFEKWKKLFPEELNGEVDKESLVEKYIEGIENDTDLPKEELKEKLDEFSGKLNSYNEVLADAGIYPSFYKDTFHDWVRGTDVFKDKETFSSFVWNHTLREKEKIEDEPTRMKERLEREPLADNEECNAGIYREALEPQVAEAVFNLRKKGYGTFQSGYDDLITGSQFIDFNQEDTEILKNTFNETELQSLAREGLRVEIQEKPDRATFILIPNDGRQALDFWKTVWNGIAEKLPDKGKPAEPPVNLGSYGTFMERQLKLRNGEKTYLGYGLEYDGSKVVEKKEE